MKKRFLLILVALYNIIMKKILSLLIFFIISIGSNTFADIKLNEYYEQSKKNAEYTYKCVGTIIHSLKEDLLGKKLTTHIGYEKQNNYLIPLVYDEDEKEFTGPLGTIIDLGSRYSANGNIDHVYIWYDAFLFIEQNKLLIQNEGKIYYYKDILLDKKNKFFTKQYEKLMMSDNLTEAKLEKYTNKVHKHFIKKYKYSSPIKLNDLSNNGATIFAREEYECERIK